MARLNVVLYQPEIPQNTGNIGRTCVAADAKLWIVRPMAFRIDDSHLRRSGLDYWQYLEWQDLADRTAAEALFYERRAFFFTKFATRRYTDVEYREGDFLVFGCESAGLPDEWRERYADQCVSMPMDARVRSLNLSNAVAIGVYEALRQFDVR